MTGLKNIVQKQVKAQIEEGNKGSVWNEVTGKMTVRMTGSKMTGQLVEIQRAGRE